MNLSDLKPGLYVLSRDVHNPIADKRYKYDWTYWSSWPKGMAFIVRPDVDFGCAIRRDSNSSRELYPIGKYGDPERYAQFMALVDALEPKQNIDLEDRFRAEGLGWGNLHSPVLDELIRVGKITANDCIEALRAYLARPEEG